MQNWKNYKIIFSDFDGTLVHSDFKLSAELNILKLIGQLKYEYATLNFNGAVSKTYISQ